MPVRRSRRGSHAVEFALLAPVLVAIVTGIADYGWFFFQQQGVATAAREAARAAVLTPFEGDPVAAAEERASSALAANAVEGDAEVLVTWMGSTPDLGVRVEVTVPFHPFFGLVPAPERTRSSLVMRLEHQPDDEQAEGIIGEPWPG